jgi:predicted esterase
MKSGRWVVAVLAAGLLVWPAAGQPRSVRVVRVPPPLRVGSTGLVRVQGPTRLDWLFAAPAGSSLVALGAYDSTQTTYQLLVPPAYRHATPHPLVLFVSPSATPNEAAAWEWICRKYGVLYATPYRAGDNVPAVRRTRIVLDVLDDVRQRLNVDADRVYLAGLSDGARLSARIAFSLPEYTGGVLCLGGVYPLRDEAWLRDRAAARLSVGLVTGELDPNRGEVERYHAAVLRGARVRNKLWVVPRHGHALPAPAVLEEAFLWLDGAVEARRALAKRYPASRLAGAAPSGAEQAKAIVEEAAGRLEDPKLRDSGLFQLAGVLERWKETPAAREARKQLREYNAKADRKWDVLLADAQQEHAHRDASAFTAWLDGPLPPRAELLKGLLLGEAVAKWEAVVKLGAHTRLGKDARARAAALRQKMLAW